MKIQITLAVLSTVLVAGCGSSSSSTPSDVTQEDSVDGVVVGGSTDVGGSTGVEDTTDTEGGIVPDQFTGSFLQLGALTITDLSFDSSVQSSASFLQLSSEVSATDLVDAALGAVDQCFVGLAGGGGFVESLEFQLNLPGIDQQSISAGEIITLSSAEGSYGELEQSEQFGFISYAPQTALGSPSPDTIVVDIPGDAFPAFSNIAAPRPAVVGGLNPDIGGTITSSANVFAWTPTGVTGSTVTIRAGEADFDPLGFQVILGCRVIDDGSFTIPESTISRLNSQFGTTSWSLALESVESEVNMVQQNGGAIVLVTRNSE